MTSSSTTGSTGATRNGVGFVLFVFLRADDIVERSRNRNVVVRHLDLASLRSVRKFADELVKSEKRLDVLVNNAGCAGMGEKKLTEDGLELQMATNYFGHFLLTNLLLGKLDKGNDYLG